MPDPILLLVDEDQETLASLASALARRGCEGRHGFAGEARGLGV